MRIAKTGCLILWIAVVGMWYGTSSAFGQARQIELNYATHMPPQHTLAKMADLWGKEVEKRTNGRVKVTLFSAGTLLAGDKMYEGVVKGIADIGLTTLGFTRGRFPLSEVIDLPLGYKNAISAARMADDYYNKFKPKEFDAVQVMYFQAHGPGVIHSKEPAYKLEDFRGLKIRCTGLSAKVANALGATPVAMPVADAYDALSRGVVDASMAPVETGQTLKWGEVTKYIIEAPAAGYTTAFAIVMNKNVWKSLPPDIQKTIVEINKEWVEKEGKAWDDADAAGLDYASREGVKIITFSKEENERVEKAVKPILDQYAQDIKKKSLPGDEALKFCVERLKSLQ